MDEKHDIPPEVDAPPKEKHGRQGEGGGPKPKPIDLEQVAILAGIQCTYEEIAGVMKIGKRQFINRVNEDFELRKIIEDGWANGKASIRRQQYKLLSEGNATMGIWLGKQYLGQRDQWAGELAGAGGKALFGDLTKLREKFTVALAVLPPELRAKVAEQLLGADAEDEKGK